MFLLQPSCPGTGLIGLATECLDLGFAPGVIVNHSSRSILEPENYLPLGLEIYGNGCFF